MAELGTPTNNATEAADAKGGAGGGRSKDEVALDLMKFIAVNAGFGKSGQPSAGFSGKGGSPHAGRTRRRSVEPLRSLPESRQQGSVRTSSPAPGLLPARDLSLVVVSPRFCYFFFLAGAFFAEPSLPALSSQPSWPAAFLAAPSSPRLLSRRLLAPPSWLEPSWRPSWPALSLRRPSWRQLSWRVPSWQLS